MQSTTKKKKNKTFMDSKPTTYLIKNVKQIAKVVDIFVKLRAKQEMKHQNMK
jgi:hypothetical protein